MTSSSVTPHLPSVNYPPYYKHLKTQGLTFFQIQTFHLLQPLQTCLAVHWANISYGIGAVIQTSRNHMFKAGQACGRARNVPAAKRAGEAPRFAVRKTMHGEAWTRLITTLSQRRLPGELQEARRCGVQAERCCRTDPALQVLWQKAHVKKKY